MTNREQSLWAEIKAKLTPVKIMLTLLGMVGMAILTGVAQPALSWLTDTASDLRDDWTCKGRAAMAEGDRITELATQDASRAQDHFRQANLHYEKAYKCGYADAGIRLAVAHCMGLGTPESMSATRQLVLEIESKHPGKIGRAGDVRKACNL